MAVPQFDLVRSDDDLRCLHFGAHIDKTRLGKTRVHFDARAQALGAIRFGGAQSVSECQNAEKI